jgi:hypothetical protein
MSMLHADINAACPCCMSLQRKRKIGCKIKQKEAKMRSFVSLQSVKKIDAKRTGYCVQLFIYLAELRGSVSGNACGN